MPHFMDITVPKEWTKSTFKTLKDLQNHVNYKLSDESQEILMMISLKTSRLFFTARLHPQFGSADWCGRNISESAHLSSTAAASCTLALQSASSERIPFDRWEVCRNSKFQNLSPPSVWFEESNFLQYTGDTDAKNDAPEFSHSNSVILRIFWSGPLWSRPN